MNSRISWVENPTIFLHLHLELSKLFVCATNFSLDWLKHLLCSLTSSPGVTLLHFLVKSCLEKLPCFQGFIFILLFSKHKLEKNCVLIVLFLIKTIKQKKEKLKFSCDYNLILFKHPNWEVDVDPIIVQNQMLDFT